jgi:hypothetical protein
MPLGLNFQKKEVCELILQERLLNGIPLGRAISDFNNRMITSSEFPSPLNQASIMKRDLIKLTTLLILKHYKFFH